jgi:hypothetical protein
MCFCFLFFFFLKTFGLYNFTCNNFLSLIFRMYVYLSNKKIIYIYNNIFMSLLLILLTGIFA